MRQLLALALLAALLPCPALAQQPQAKANAEPKLPDNISVETDVEYAKAGDVSLRAGRIQAEGGKRHSAALRRVDSRRRLAGRQQVERLAACSPRCWPAETTSASAWAIG